MTRSTRLAVLWVVLATFVGCSAPATRAPAANEDESFTVVALPDTQYYSQRLPITFALQTHWIAQHAKELNIQFVVGLGDIVDDGAEIPQWHHALTALETLKEGHVPFFLAIGNHDYNPPFIDASPRPRGARNYNQFVGPAFYRDQPAYAGSMEKDSNENFFGTMHLAGKDYLVLVLEFSPRDTTLEWASQVVQSHPIHDVIIVTHSYLFTDNTRITECSSFNKRNYGLVKDNDGEEVWNKFASKFPNIRMVLTGHIPVGGVGRRFDVGLKGNLVNEILSDYQFEANAGNGWLRIMTFHPSQNRVDVQTYSPYLAAHPELHVHPWKADPMNQFSVEYENPAQGRFTAGTIKGVVRSARSQDVCKGVPGATVRFPGGTATTDANGHFTAVVTGPSLDPHQTYQAAQLTVEKKGWLPTTARATVRDDATNDELIYLEPAPAPIAPAHPARARHAFH